DEQLGKTAYIAGDKLSLADFVLLSHVDPLEAIEIDVNKYPNLAKWRKPLLAADFYQKVHKFYGAALMAQS
ncbi:MAG: glutathione S-transferase C-terminal domain-containing protein, partial [Candidatus Omnitrophica bacterium]|nr:glutathione S-transferase C-terminal domain-containing protein [Candidatus Omnitrophota bacterium]